MIQSLLNFFKIGSPKVDLVLHSHRIAPGAIVKGSFHIYGGWLPQKIKRLECDFVKETKGRKTELIAPAATVLMSQTMEPKGMREVPFHYQIPEDLPPTTNAETYRLKTKIVFTDDVKTFDHDELVVLN
ncbi:sporulation protein [Halobacillus sp. K22]|uniref:sporulation protein n=1 Tax=Halobacillus sp. K22 TaxID=3457431 RepID=UPI003FCD3ABB